MQLFSNKEKENSFHEPFLCPVSRLSSSDFVNKWKSIPKQSEQYLILGKLFTSSIENIVNRLKSQNIILCVYKRNDNKYSLYLSVTTKDNSLILCEFTIIRSDFLYGKIKYKSENNIKEILFENILAMIMSDVEKEEKEEVICR